MGTTVKTLRLTDAIRYRIALVRRAEDALAAGEIDYSAYELVKLELADDVLRQIRRQEMQLTRLPARAPVVPVVEVTIRPKRRRPA